MNFRTVILFLFCSVLSGLVRARSFGQLEYVDVLSVGGQPAICLPQGMRKGFGVGWIHFSESYVLSPNSWFLSLKEGASPLRLNPGGCIAYGVVPAGYEHEIYQGGSNELKFELNRTYIFRVIPVDRPTDRYVVTFCVGQSAGEVLEFHKYIYLPDGSVMVPACDAKRNGNVSE